MCAASTRACSSSPTPPAVIRVARARGHEALGRRAATAAGPTDAVDQWEPAPDARVQWRTVEHDGAVAFELTWTRPHDRDRTLWRRTLVQIVATAAGDGQVVVAERLESHDPKVRGHPADDASAPALVRELVDAVRCVDGGWAVRSVPHRADAARAMELDAFVRGGRRLPVVLVARRPRRTRGCRRRRGSPPSSSASPTWWCSSTTPRCARSPASWAPAARSSPAACACCGPTGVRSDPPARHPQWRAEEVVGPRRAAAAGARRVARRSSSTRRRCASTTTRSSRGSPGPTARRSSRTVAPSWPAASRPRLEDRAAAHELVDEYQRELDDRRRRGVPARGRARTRARAAPAGRARVPPPRDACRARAPPSPSRRCARSPTPCGGQGPARAPRDPPGGGALGAGAGPTTGSTSRGPTSSGSTRSRPTGPPTGCRADFAAGGPRPGPRLGAATCASPPAKVPRDYQRRYDGRTIELGPHIRRGRSSAAADLLLSGPGAPGRRGRPRRAVTSVTARSDVGAPGRGPRRQDRDPGSVYFGPTRRDD